MTDVQQQGAPQMQRAPTPQEVATAQRTLKRLRTEIARFHKLRHENNEVAAGMRAALVTPQQAQALLSQRRDADMEQRAVAELRKVIAIVRGREPTQQDMAELLPGGLEMGLGIWPYVALAGIVAAGGSAISYFSYLNTQEERIAEETRGPVASTLRAISENTWAVVGLGGLALLGLLYWDTRSKLKQAIGAAPPRAPRAPSVRVTQLPELPRGGGRLVSQFERAQTLRRNEEGSNDIHSIETYREEGSQAALEDWEGATEAARDDMIDTAMRGGVDFDAGGLPDELQGGGFDAECRAFIEGWCEAIFRMVSKEEEEEEDEDEDVDEDEDDDLDGEE